MLTSMNQALVSEAACPKQDENMQDCQYVTFSNSKQTGQWNLTQRCQPQANRKQLETDQTNKFQVTWTYKGDNNLKIKYAESTMYRR